MSHHEMPNQNTDRPGRDVLMAMFSEQQGLTADIDRARYEATLAFADLIDNIGRWNKPLQRALHSELEHVRSRLQERKA